MFSPFTEEKFDELAAWLERRSKGILDIVELEGLLTALVIGPNLVHPTTWLPKVWGGKNPKFNDLEELNRFVALLMGLHNDLALVFDQAADQFEPTFYESTSAGKQVQIVDEWCVGFLKGMRLDAASWKPLKRERPELLKPIELFGSKAGWRELDAGGAEKMHRLWAPRITPAVIAIHAFWIPHRILKQQTMTGQRSH